MELLQLERRALAAHWQAVTSWWDELTSSSHEMKLFAEHVRRHSPSEAGQSRRPTVWRDSTLVCPALARCATTEKRAPYGVEGEGANRVTNESRPGSRSHWLSWTNR